MLYALFEELLGGICGGWCARAAAGVPDGGRYHKRKYSGAAEALHRVAAARFAAVVVGQGATPLSKKCARLS